MSRPGSSASNTDPPPGAEQQPLPEIRVDQSLPNSASFSETTTIPVEEAAHRRETLTFDLDETKRCPWCERVLMGGAVNRAFHLTDCGKDRDPRPRCVMVNGEEVLK